MRALLHAKPTSKDIEEETTKPIFLVHIANIEDVNTAFDLLSLDVLPPI